MSDEVERLTGQRDELRAVLFRLSLATRDARDFLPETQTPDFVFVHVDEALEISRAVLAKPLGGVA